MFKIHSTAIMLYFRKLDYDIEHDLPQVVWFPFGTFVIPSQMIEQFFASPTVGFVVLPEHLTQELSLL